MQNHHRQTSQLKLTASRGNIEAVKQHLAAGTDVNAKADDEWTPLHEAAWHGHKEVIELLIAEGADVAQNPETLPDASRGPPESFLNPDINPRLSTHGTSLVDKTLATQQLATQHPASSNQPLVYETLGTRNGPAECAKRLN